MQNKVQYLLFLGLGYYSIYQQGKLYIILMIQGQQLLHMFLQDIQLELSHLQSNSILKGIQLSQKCYHFLLLESEFLEELDIILDLKFLISSSSQQGK